VRAACNDGPGGLDERMTNRPCVSCVMCCSLPEEMYSKQDVEDILDGLRKVVRVRRGMDRDDGPRDGQS
jgi:hypothetical protein